MPRVETRKILAVDKNKLFQTVFKYQDYPKFIHGLKSIEVRRTGLGTARLTYHLSLIKDIVFTVDLIEDKDLGTVKWSLVASNFFETINGHWKVKELGAERCEVEYDVELESRVPIPRLILRQLVKRTLPGILKSFEKQAQKAA